MSSQMEEDPTPIPSMGMRKSLIMNEEGVVTGEEVGQDLGHTDSGYEHIPQLMEEVMYDPSLVHSLGVSQ